MRIDLLIVSGLIFATCVLLVIKFIFSINENLDYNRLNNVITELEIIDEELLLLLDEERRRRRKELFRRIRVVLKVPKKVEEEPEEKPKEKPKEEPKKDPRRR